MEGATAEPRLLAEELARAKALSLRDEEPDATLIGCDQLVSFEGRIFGKPASVEGAVDQLSTLAGRSHELITALAVWHDGRVLVAYRRDDLEDAEPRPRRDRTLRRGRHADRLRGELPAGGRGITLFEAIDSEDHSSITGLPLIALTTILRQIGFIIP